MIATIPEIEALIDAGAPVAIGVSGGKDSQAAALATCDHLDRRRHSGPRVLIHSDLGSVEWSASLPACETLARHLGVELIVVRRRAGDLMQRWEARWQSSIRRYVNLETVTLVLPWSTPGMRFCTSELKTHVIDAELRRRFRGQPVIGVTGVRRAESAARARAPVANLTKGGWSWRPISNWSVREVFAYIADRGLTPHEAYTRFGMSRVSCRFCIMSSRADLAAAAAVPESSDIYRRIVALEIASTFAFQGAGWLGDVAPRLLSDAERNRLVLAKLAAARRSASEARIAPGMLYVEGWPTRMLTDAEAQLLAQVRTSVSRAVSLPGVRYLDMPSIHGRYAELMALRDAREGAAA